MPITNPRLWLTACGLALATICVANEPLTLEVAVARAIERSETAVMAAVDREVAIAQTKAARAWPSPTLDIESENVLGSGPFSGFDAAENTIALAQDWQIGGQRRAAIGSARAAEEAANVAVELTRIELRRDVRIAFASAVAADRLADIARDRARIAAEASAAVEKRFAAGLESELERSRAVVDLSAAQAAARRAATHAAAQRRQLASHWREDTVSGTLAAPWFDAVDASQPADGDLQAHPQQRRAVLQLQAAEKALQRERALRAPMLTTTVGVRRFPEETDGEDQAFVLGLSFPLPFGDRNGVAIAEARAAVTRAQLALDTTSREIRAARSSAQEELQAALLEARALAEVGVPAARTAAQLARAGYDAGRIPLIDRLTSERVLSDAEEQLVSAQLAVQHARAVLESLSAPSASH